MKSYEYIIVGAGISGCSTAHELSKHSNSILIIDKNSGIAQGASGAAGAFLSPLLGKPNLFKNLVSKSLEYSTKFYQKNFPLHINNCGTTRIPQNEEDEKKFQEYIPYMDFPYIKEKDGYFFPIGSVVDSSNVCESMIKSSSMIEKKFNYEVTSIENIKDIWIINNDIETQNIIFTTGSDVSLIDQFYLNIRGVWGQRIDISTSSSFSHNYHKRCSISQSKILNNGKNLVSIGATHHRNKEDIINTVQNTNELLKKANDIQELKDVEVLNHYIGARACSNDYFPVVGSIIDSQKTLDEFPYLINGTHVESKRFTRFKNGYVLTGVGGRGFVLAPYLSKLLVESIINNQEIESSISIDRLFRREVKRCKK